VGKPQRQRHAMDKLVKRPVSSPVGLHGLCALRIAMVAHRSDKNSSRKMPWVQANVLVSGLASGFSIRNVPCIAVELLQVKRC